MKTIRAIDRSRRAFQKNWVAYLILVIAVQAIIKHIFIPIYTLIFEGIMAQFGINYLSYNNLGVLFHYMGLPALEFLILGLLILLTAYAQFAFLIVVIHQIATGQPLSIKRVGGIIWRSLRSISLGSTILFAGYILIILPLVSRLFDSLLLRKLVLPDFILTVIMTNGLYAPLFILLMLALYYVGIRSIRVLPLMLTKQMAFHEAWSASWKETQHKFWFYAWRIILIGLLTEILSWLFTTLAVLAQSYFDGHLASNAGLITALSLTSLVQVLILVVVDVGTVLFAMVILFPTEIPIIKDNYVLDFPNHAKLGSWVPVTIAVVVGLVLLVFNMVYLTDSFSGAKNMTLISHRGVNGDNGVQNTIPVLEKTAKDKPDYVEMDIRETKDHQWVVMHDSNLKHLTGVNAKPEDLTLDELTRLTARENGHAAPVASFDDYLATAERIHQKLLVEIKTSKKDSPDYMQNFNKKYGKRLVKDGSMLHSLDYHVISDIRVMQPKLPASFILPYTLVLPNTPANAYTLEQSTLNQQIVDRAHEKGQKVFAWDIDEEDQMHSMIYLNVDALITDNLSVAKSVVYNEDHNPSYAKKMKQFLNMD
ncbi:glycerophosphodiester phosphodiesterase [Eupransor demetentiae]|uniref:Membrane domain (UgpQ1) n=1 Tax=Eupransor demetentiae TaxID=3109584 RepID=A0ABM9N6A3_9LACO|nr:Membrane-anchored glycerophosphoryl diester phosphodiesterase (GDPDase) [Lactobacillaceae bacterium LMG 33000]